MEAVATTAEAGVLSAHKTKRELNLTSSVYSAVALGYVVSMPELIRKPCSAACGCLCCPASVAKKQATHGIFRREEYECFFPFFFLLFLDEIQQRGYRVSYDVCTI